MTDILSYIQCLELPAAPPSRGPEEQETPPAFQSVAQALTVASQMTEFSRKVPQSIRPAISNGLLLGQLAADKATATQSDPKAWFDTFNSVMKQIGWQSTLSEFNEQTISEKNAALHKAIIPIVTAIFGPAVAASSIIISVLNGLDSMDRDAPWITLFQQKSNKVNATNFGLSYVDGGDGGGATLKTVYFSLQGSQVFTQFLFFKLSSSDAKMKSAQCQMSLSPETVAMSGATLQQKVAPFIIENIKNIDI
jgi:hypothetical protein